MKLLTVIQARTGSTRLPGKVMMPLAGKPLLTRMVERVLAAKHAGTVVVATTTLPKDDVVVEICKAEGFNVFRGDPENLLDRHYKAALEYSADAVVKIPSDCPLIDPAVIDKVLAIFTTSHQLPIIGHPDGLPSSGKDNGSRPNSVEPALLTSTNPSALNTHHSSPNYDFVSDLHPASYPDGNDVELMTFQALETAWKNATLEMELQHTTPYIWERPEQFRIANVLWETGLDYSMSHRWTIDYPEDYSFIKAVYDELYATDHHFGLNDILGLLQKRRDIFQINSKYAGVNWYRNHLGELKTVNEKQTRQL